MTQVFVEQPRLHRACYLEEYPLATVNILCSTDDWSCFVQCGISGRAATIGMLLLPEAAIVLSWLCANLH